MPLTAAPVTPTPRARTTSLDGGTTTPTSQRSRRTASRISECQVGTGATVAQEPNPRPKSVRYVPNPMWTSMYRTRTDCYQAGNRSLTCGNASRAPGGTRTPDPRIRRRKARVQPVLSRAAWCWSVRLGERFVPNVVRPAGFCVSCPAASVCRLFARRAPTRPGMPEPCSPLVWTPNPPYTC